MPAPKNRTAWVISLLLIAMLVQVGFLVGFWRGEPSATKPTRIVTVSESGQVLTAFFEGVPRNPLYSLEQMAAVSRRQSMCREINSAPTGIFGRLFSIGTVYACGAANCGGSGWQEHETDCNFGYCSGSYIVARPGGENPCMGFQPLDGQHCGVECQCGQKERLRETYPGCIE